MNIYKNVKVQILTQGEKRETRIRDIYRAHFNCICAIFFLLKKTLYQRCERDEWWVQLIQEIFLYEDVLGMTVGRAHCSEWDIQVSTHGKLKFYCGHRPHKHLVSKSYKKNKAK